MKASGRASFVPLFLSALKAVARNGDASYFCAKSVSVSRARDVRAGRRLSLAAPRSRTAGRQHRRRHRAVSDRATDALPGRKRTHRVEPSAARSCFPRRSSIAGAQADDQLRCGRGEDVAYWFVKRGRTRRRRPVAQSIWHTEGVSSLLDWLRRPEWRMPGDTMNRLSLSHILCPMDLSSLSMNSLDWANALARARRAELRAFHVVATRGLVAPEALGSHQRADTITKLREALMATDSENVHTGAAVRQGDPGSQILRFAKSIRADVIVMGAAGADRPMRPIGSVTATVVSRSDCPVLIVPTGRRVDRLRAGVFKQILCAVDLAPSSVSVIRQALSLAWETHGHLRCVCVMTEPAPSSSEAQKQLVEAIPPEAHAWCDTEVIVKQGVPATEIVRATETSDVDVVVIGPPRQWTSTTQAVLAKSLCPVLVTHDTRPLPYPSSQEPDVTARGTTS